MERFASSGDESAGRRRDRLTSAAPGAANLVIGLAGRSASAARAIGGAALARPLSTVRSVGSAATGRALDTTERALTAAIDTALESPRTQRLLDRVLAQPGTQRLVSSVIGSEASGYTVEELLHSDEMDRLVTEIAESPQVREALAAQTAGLATEFGSQVRTRAASADSLAERVAQRLIGRGPGGVRASADDDSAPA